MFFFSDDSASSGGSITYVPITIEIYWEIEMTRYLIDGLTTEVQALSLALCETYDSSNGMYDSFVNCL